MKTARTKTILRKLQPPREPGPCFCRNPGESQWRELLHPEQTHTEAELRAEYPDLHRIRLERPSPLKIFTPAEIAAFVGSIGPYLRWSRTGPDPEFMRAGPDVVKKRGVW